MTNKRHIMYYDYKKRTSGGFLDAIFLSSLIITGAVLIFLAMMGVK